MQKQLIFHGRPIDIKLSKLAAVQNQTLDSILLIEIQIYFSCLLSKRLAFYTDQPQQGTWQLDTASFASMLLESQPLTENIFVRFNTVMTKSCPVSDYIGPPPVTDFIIKNQKPYVPAWLNIDYKQGQWTGEYGWPASEVGQLNTKQVRGAARHIKAGN